jgi:anti-repressor protein
MNNEIQRFDFKGAALRALTDENGEPWFVAKDACAVLELSNVSQALTRLDGDEKSSITLNDGTPGNPNRVIVSESGLYALVLASRKPEAHEFKRWVTHEVLPQIRRTGGYIPTTDADDDMTILAKAVMIGQRTMEAQKRRIAEQQTRIVELEPKARFADAVAASDGTCLIGELAKMLRQNGLDIGQNRLFEILRQDGYLGKIGSNRNVPTQRAMDLGLFRIKETAITHSDGHVTINRTAKVTGKGQTYFISRYCPDDKPEPKDTL